LKGPVHVPIAQAPLLHAAFAFATEQASHVDEAQPFAAVGSTHASLHDFLPCGQPPSGGCRVIASSPASSEPSARLASTEASAGDEEKPLHALTPPLEAAQQAKINAIMREP